MAGLMHDEEQETAVWRVTLPGSEQATVCAVGKVSLLDCRVSAGNENAMLVVGENARAFVALCNLSNCTTGAEVREGGSLQAIDTTIYLGYSEGCHGVRWCT